MWLALPRLEHPLPVALHKDSNINERPSPVDSIAFPH